MDIEYWFFGSDFSTPQTGGQLYNSKIVQFKQKRSEKLITLEYPWGGFLKNLSFDLFNALRLLFSVRRRVVIVNESQHQRLCMTLLASFLNPRVKSVVMFHQLAYLRRNSSLHRRVTQFVDKLLIRFSDISVSAGLYLTDQMQQLVSERFHGKIWPVLTTCQGRMTYSEDKIAYSCLFVGSIVPAKGILELINSIHLVPTSLRDKLQITLAGPIPDEPFYEQCLQLIADKKLEDQFHFLGKQDLDSLRKLYLQSDLFLFPTHAEGMPMSLMEAMTAGCIPIVFNNSALPYMVENGSTGFICENLNTESYAKCIVDYYAMKQSDRIKLRKQACEKAAAYIRSWDEVADEFWKVIEK